MQAWYCCGPSSRCSRRRPLISQKQNRATVATYACESGGFLEYKVRTKVGSARKIVCSEEAGCYTRTHKGCRAQVRLARLKDGGNIVLQVWESTLPYRI